MALVDATQNRNGRPLRRAGIVLVTGLWALGIASCTESGGESHRDLDQVQSAAQQEPDGIQAFEVRFTAPTESWHRSPVTVAGTISDPECNTAPTLQTEGVNGYTLSGGNGSWTFTKTSVGAGRYAPARVTATSGCSDDAAEATRSFGVDGTAPTLLLARLNQNGVDPEDSDTWPTVGSFGRLPLSVRAQDPLSGMHTISAVVEQLDADADADIFSHSLELSGTPASGASPVTVSACNEEEYCADEQLDLGTLSGVRHVLRVTLTDAAGNTSTGDFYFVRQGLREALLAWRSAIPTDSDNGEARAALTAARAALDTAVASYDAGAYGNIALLAQLTQSKVLTAEALDRELDLGPSHTAGLELGRVFTGFLDARLVDHREEVDDNETLETAEDFLDTASDSDDIGTILNATANAFFWMEDGRAPMVALNFADTQTVLATILGQMATYLGRNPALVGATDLGAARTSLVAVKVLVDRVVSNGDTALTDRQHVDLLLGLTNTAEDLRDSQALGAWVRNWQWGLTQIVYIYASRALRNAGGFIGVFHPVYLEGERELARADTFRGQRRADDFMSLLVASRCLTIGIYNKAYEPDVDPPQACCPAMLRFQGYDQSFPVPRRCQPPFCGDGVLSEGEQCDDGNNIDNDGCDSNCHNGPYCGDGDLGEGEVCDDGNNNNGDGCDSQCRREPYCGDGQVQNDEVCDDGNRNNRDTCNNLCRPVRLDVDAGGRFTNGFPQGESSTFFFSTQHNPTRVNLVTSNGQGGCPADTTMTLYRVVNNSLTQVAFDDDGGPGVCSLLGVNLTTPGDYEVKIAEYGNDAPISTFVIDVEIFVPVADSGSFAGAFGAGGRDLFRFTLSESTAVTLQTGDGEDGCPAGNTTMALFPLTDGARGNRIAFDDDGGVGVCSLLEGQLDTGSYEVEVRGAGDTAHAGYALAVTFENEEPGCGDSDVGEGEQCDDGNETDGDGCSSICRFERIDVNRGGQFAGALPEGRTQTFFFSVEHNTTHANLETSNGGNGCPADTVMSLYRVVNNTRTLVDDDDDGGQGLCSLLQVDLTPGLYEAVIVEYDEGAIESYVFESEIFVAVGADGDYAGAFGTGGRDLFRFTLNDETEVALSTGDGEDGCPAGNTILRLFPLTNGSRGNLITSDDDGGVGLCSRIVRTLAAGTYEAEVVAANDGSHAGYQLTAQFTGDEEPGCGDGDVGDGEQCDDGNNSNGDGCDAACRHERIDVNDGGKFAGGLEEGRTQVFFFSVEHNPSHVTLRTSDGNGGCPDVDTTMRLYRVGDGRSEVDYDDDGGVGRCSLLDRDLPPGVYEADIQDYGNNEGIDAFTFEADIFVNVPGSGNYQGAFRAAGHDLFRFTLDRTTAVTFATGDGNGGCPSGDTTIGLFPFSNGNPGNRLAFDDDGGVGLCSRLSQSLAAGTYQIEVRTLNNAQHTGYVLTATIEGASPRCGDGEVQNGEQCDDGNTGEGDGCNSLCFTERLDVNVGGRFTSGFAVGRTSSLVFSTENDPTRVRFETSNGNGGCPGDTLVRLYRVVNNTRTQVALDDDGGVGLCSLLDTSVSTPGNYELTVEDHGNNDAIALFSIDVAIYVEISEGGDFDGAFGQGGHDLFRFTLNAASAVTLDTGDGNGGCPAGDTTMGLFPFANGSPGDRIQFDDDGGVGACSRIVRTLAAGTYQVEIRGFGNSAHAGYTLTADIEGPDAPCGDGQTDDGEQCDDGNMDNGDGCSSACFTERPNVNGNGSFEGGFTAGQNMVFVFEVENNPTHARLATNDGDGGCPADTTMRLFRVVNNVRTQVAYNDDSNNTLCSTLDLDLTPGTYEVEVAEFGNDAAIPSFNLDADIYVNITGGGDFDGAFPEEGYDVFRFTLDDAATVALQTGDGDGDCPDGDTVMTLYSWANGRIVDELEYNDDDGDSLCSFIDRLLPGGTYEVRVGGYDDESHDGYVLSVEFVESDGACGDGEVNDNEHCDDGNLNNGDGCNSLCKLDRVDVNLRGNYTGGIPVDGAEVFYFTVENNPTVGVFETSNGNGGCPGDTTMYLYQVVNNQRTQIAFNDDGGQGLCSLISRPNLAPGDYEIEIQEYSDEGIDLFTLSVDLYVNVNTPGSFSGGFEDGDHDLFRFTLNSSRSVVVFTGNGQGGCPGDTTMNLLSVAQNGARTDIAYDDDGGDGLCSRIARTLGAGNYEVRVQGFGGDGVDAYVFTYQ